MGSEIGMQWQLGEGVQGEMCLQGAAFGTLSSPPRSVLRPGETTHFQKALEGP